MNLETDLKSILGSTSIMLKRITSFILVFGFCVNAFSQEQYPVHPDSVVKTGVPQGKIEGPFEMRCKTFPGTVRNYWIYVPAQYDEKEPAAICVCQDGLGLAKGWNLPTVFDNLIHKKEMPVTVGIFVSPGIVPPLTSEGQPRYNRSFEYDSMGSRYATFVIDELLPAVSAKYSLSENPNDRMIMGSSSGAIAAFGVAWERPDQFRRVFSSVGTFVSLRGGNEYPTLIRKYEPRPIRIFLQDGSNDNNLYAGGWWEANLDMLASLKFAGYEVNHVFGKGGHNRKHSAAIMPDAIRWLWSDYPEPVTNVPGKTRRTDVLIEDEGWKLVSEGHKFTEGPAAGPQGEIYFTDIPANRIYSVSPDGKKTIFAEDTGGANGLMVGPDGKLYACANNDRKIVKYDLISGAKETVVDNINSNDLVLTTTGGYVTDPTNDKIWHFNYDGEKKEVASGLGFPNGIQLTNDLEFLLVTNTKGRFNTGFQVSKDGTLINRQQYGHLHRGVLDNDTGADGAAMDQSGRLYVTTRMGVQVLDQLGRVHLILEKPGKGWLSNVTFGGVNRDLLYVTCGERVYRRRLNAKGASTVQGPTKPPRPNL